MKSCFVLSYTYCMTGMHERALTAGMWFLFAGLACALPAMFAGFTVLYGITFFWFIAAAICLLIGGKGLAQQVKDLK